MSPFSLFMIIGSHYLFLFWKKLQGTPSSDKIFHDFIIFLILSGPLFPAWPFSSSARPLDISKGLYVFELERLISILAQSTDENILQEDSKSKCKTLQCFTSTNYWAHSLSHNQIILQPYMPFLATFVPGIYYTNSVARAAWYSGSRMIRFSALIKHKRHGITS